MKVDDCFELGSIIKPRSFKGEVIVYLDVDHPEEYLEMESIFVQLNEQLVPFFVEQIRPIKKNQIRVKFDGINSDEEAKRILKKKLFLPNETKANLVSSNTYESFVGFNVVDQKHGDLGKITDYVKNKSNPIFVIEHISGQEIFVPVASDLLEKIDEKNKILYTNCPDGLIELYLDV